MERVSQMDKVAKIFGKKLGESFDVSVAGEVNRYRCMFTNDGLYIWEEDNEYGEWIFDDDEILHNLLTGGAWVHEA